MSRVGIYKCRRGFINVTWDLYTSVGELINVVGDYR